VTLYIDGALAASSTNLQKTVDNMPVSLGDQWGSPRLQKTQYDEVRLSSTVRSGDWIATEYNNQGNPNAFYVLGPEPGGISVSLAPGTASLNAGQSQQFTPTVTGTGNTAVTWLASPNVGTISTSGLYTAPSPINNPQSVTLTATSVADNTKSAAATITLNSSAGLSINPASATFASGLSAGSLTVTSTLPSTAWTVSNDQATWVTGVTPSGTGSGTINFTVQANGTGTARIAHLTIRAASLPDQVFTITQSAVVPAISVSPPSWSPNSRAFNGTTLVTSNTSWSVSAAPAWITITTGTGVGNVTGGEPLRYTAQANNTASPRSGSITITTTAGSPAATATFTLNQDVLRSLQISPNAMTLPQGSTFLFSAVLDGVTDNTSVNWSTTLGSVTSSGLYTAPPNGAGFPSGTLTIAFPATGMTAQASLVIVPPAQQPPTIAITPSSGIGTGGSFSILADDVNGFNQIQWIAVQFGGALSTQPYCQATVFPTSPTTSTIWFVPNGFMGYSPGYTPTSPSDPIRDDTLNHICTLNLTQSSLVQTSSTSMVSTLAFALKTPLTGTRNIWTFGQGNGYSSGTQPVVSGTYTVTGGPTSDLVSPTSGTGPVATFTAQVSDTSGAAYLATVEFLLGPTTASRALACDVQYRRAENKFYLRDDADTTWLGGFTPGGNVTVSNSQCTLTGTGSAAVASGNSITLTLPLSFPSWYGAMNVYLLASDVNGVSSSYQQKGTWTVDHAPQTPSMSPTSGNGAGQIFTFTYPDPDGDQNFVHALIASGLTFDGSCALYYYRPTNALYLINDTADNWLGPVTPGANATLSNRLCTLNAAQSSAGSQGTTLVVTAAFSFNSSTFAGPKSAYLYQGDNYGLISGWAQGGTWTIPGTVQTPVPVSVTPSSGSTTSTTFSFAYSDPLGYHDMTILSEVINTTLSVAGGCVFAYSPLHNWIELFGDSGNWQTPVTLGTNTMISNSYCTINAMQSAGSGSGNNFTLNVAITGTAAFSGAKTIWAMAQGVNGTSSWQTVGTITAPINVSVSPGSGTLHASQAMQFSATVTNAQSTTAVTWSISPNIGTISSSGLYTSPATNTVARTITVTATSVADPSRVGTATITLPAPTVIRVNIGGQAYTDTSGNAWAADTYSPQGTGTTWLSTNNYISGAADGTVYQTAVLVSPSGQLSYNFVVPSGAYTVTLKFASIPGTPTYNGLNSFDVTVNNNTIYFGFFPYGAAGGSNTATDLSTTVTAGTTSITITLQGTRPYLNAIDIESQGY
jgi:Malectin domain/Putative binding domain, N-terminal